MANGKKARKNEPSRVRYKAENRAAINKARKAKNTKAFQERKKIDGHKPRGITRKLARHPELLKKPSAD
jgi:hypothetical protein